LFHLNHPESEIDQVIAESLTLLKAKEAVFLRPSDTVEHLPSGVA
jgi:hypothetical protein